MIVTAKQGADVQYLVSGIVQEALKQKFKTLFGRDPVARTETDPMKVVDARIPDIIAETLNSDIAKVLKTTAVESTELTSGDLPTINSATLLYSILEDTPCRISMEAISEYKELQDNAEPVITAVNDTTSISIQNGTAFVPEEMSSITIGVFVDNKQFAAEFQYRLSNAGGNEIESDKKKEVFDKLYQELPGGDQKTDATVKQELLKVVGLNEFAAPLEPPKETKAPGPAATAVPEAAPETASETASIHSNEQPHTFPVASPEAEEVYLYYGGGQYAWAKNVDDFKKFTGVPPDTYAYRIGSDCPPEGYKGSGRGFANDPMVKINKLTELSSLEGFVRQNGYGWDKYSRTLRQLLDVSNDDLDDAEREYINYASKHAPLKQSTIVRQNRTVECGDIVTSSKYPKRVFSIASIFESEVMLEDSSNGKHYIDEPQNLSIY